MSGKEHAENSEQLSMFMTPRDIMQRNWSKTEPRPRAVDSGKRMEGGRDDLMPVEWVDPGDDHFFREGTHGQWGTSPALFKPGYYRYQTPGGDARDDVVYTTTDEEGYGAILAVTPAIEEPISKYGFYDDNDPRNDPDYYDADGGSNFPGPTDDYGLPVDWDPGPVQGEMFRQRKGHAHNLFANIENRSRTLSLLGVAERHQTRNFGPATVSSSLTPDSFGLLTKIAEVEKDKENKTVAWGYGGQPTKATEPAGEMRPGEEDHHGNRESVPLHEEGQSDFPSDMIKTENVEHYLDLAEGGITQFTEAEVKEGKRFVREQWTSRKPRGKKIPATNKSTRQLSLFPQTAREYWEANL